MIQHAYKDQSSQSLKVIYLLPTLNLAQTSLAGVRKKVIGQLQAFEEAGFNAELVDTREFFADPLHGDTTRASGTQELLASLCTWPAKQAGNLRRKFRNKRFALRKIRTAGKTIIYVRYTRTRPGLLLFYGALKCLPNVVRIYLEIPTWPFQHEGVSNKFNHALWPLTRLLVHRIVTFDSSTNILGVQTINITNGVSAEENPLQRPPAKADPTFRMVFVGQMYRWAGLDRLLRGIARHVRQSESRHPIALRIAGAGKMLDEWRQLASALEIEAEVNFEGICSGARLEEVYDGAHIAIGNLANHRRRLESNADLKNREYCMRGIPFVTASEDPAFPDYFKFRTQVPPDDSDVDVEDIIQFYHNLRQKEPEYSRRIREYAEQKLQWSTTMSPVIQDMMAPRR